ncbi:MAG TPA: restriction endonuclease [Allosphingosinicella sp.]|nr:restriction endonuclease [Allosphingosinicella sp.]
MNRGERNVFYARSRSLDLGASNEWGDPRRRYTGWLADRYQELLGTDWVVASPDGTKKPQPRILTGGRCTYCGENLVFYGQPDNEPFVGDQSFAGECEGCGWWFCESQQVRHAEGQYDGGEYHEGILSEFNISEIELPVNLVVTHLRNRFEDVHTLHPRTFERLCRDILSEHFHCDVTLTGYSKDHGVDLYLIRGNENYAVQLKRRSRSISEGVVPVREFLGAMVASGVQKGLFISTATAFTREAKRLVSSPNLAQKGLHIELIDRGALQGILEQRELLDKPWKRISTVRPPKVIFHGRGGREPRFPW